VTAPFIEQAAKEDESF